MTDAEKLLWSKLRNRQLHGWKFRRQHTIGRYIVDFVCVNAKLVIEVDGGQHSEDSDRQRTLFLESERWWVIRFWNNDVLENIDGVCSMIIEALTKK